MEPAQRVRRIADDQAAGYQCLMHRNAEGFERLDHRGPMCRPGDYQERFAGGVTLSEERGDSFCARLVSIEEMDDVLGSDGVGHCTVSHDQLSSAVVSEDTPGLLGGENKVLSHLCAIGSVPIGWTVRPS